MARIAINGLGRIGRATFKLIQENPELEVVAVNDLVPVVDGSLSDITFLTERDTTVEEVNRIFKEDADSEQYRGILGVTEEPVVSSDIIQDPRASIVDLGMTRVVDGDLVKVMAWYDNEWGYSAQMVREAVRMLSGSGTG
jgi:glyceraldehyde 3-phosphate dehydrogenase